jgi:hypothetical protein
VAAIALLCGDKVFTVHAGRCSPVVTAIADTDDIGMIDPDHRYPGGIAMAILADIGGVDMAAVLTRCRGAVMAAETVVGDAAVVEVGRYPATGGVAQITGVVARHVVRRLTGRGGAVVAAVTAADDIGVVDPDHRYPGGVAMTILTHIGGLDMRRILTDCCRTVMTAGTVCRRVGMIEGSRHPGCSCVAQITGVVAGNMGRVFTCGRGAVVAAVAAADDIGVVDPDHRHPGGIAVAVLAHIGGLDVRRILSRCRGAVVTT